MPDGADFGAGDATVGLAPTPVSRRAVHIGRWLSDVPVFDGRTLMPSRRYRRCRRSSHGHTTTLVLHPGHRADVLVGGHVRVRFEPAAS